MRRFRFYTERKNIRPSSSVKLPDFEAQHIRKTLRLQKLDTVFLFNGEKEFKARLTLVSRDAVMAKVDSVVREAKAKSFKITLVQALSKVKSFETILDQATELQVDAIQPIVTEFSVMQYDEEKLQKKHARWEHIIISGAKQCERISIPILYKLEDLSESLVNTIAESHDYLFFLTTNAEQSFYTSVSEAYSNQKATSNPISIAIFVGPEGGFSPQEKELMLNKGYTLLSLGKTILRSETAAITALSQTFGLLSSEE